MVHKTLSFYQYFDNLVNGKIKQWKLIAQTIQSSTLGFINDYLDIVCMLINKYQCPTVKDIENGKEIVMKLREMFTTRNRLQEKLTQYTCLTSLHWSKHSASNFQLPPLSEEKTGEPHI